MAVNPNFTLNPRATGSRIAAANTARDGSGALVTSFTAGASGSRLDFITFTSAQATAAASSLRIMRVFLTDTSGLNPRLISEVSLPAVTASNTAIGATATITFTNGLVIAAGQLIQTTQSVYAGVQDQTDVLSRGGDF
jgi:hypothetical protein